MAGTPQQVHCEYANIDFMPFRTVQRPETRQIGQKWPETGRTDQEGPVRVRNDPPNPLKWPKGGRKGSDNCPGETGNHQTRQKTLK